MCFPEIDSGLRLGNGKRPTSGVGRVALNHRNPSPRHLAQCRVSTAVYPTDTWGHVLCLGILTADSRGGGHWQSHCLSPVSPLPVPGDSRVTSGQPESLPSPITLDSSQIKPTGDPRGPPASRLQWSIRGPFSFLRLVPRMEFSFIICCVLCGHCLWYSQCLAHQDMDHLVNGMSWNAVQWLWIEISFPLSGVPCLVTSAAVTVCIEGNRIHSDLES